MPIYKFQGLPAKRNLSEKDKIPTPQVKKFSEDKQPISPEKPTTSKVVEKESIKKEDSKISK